ncbi:MAG: ABC transporter substrate-binding protein [Bacteroidota bacterium]
MRFSASGLFFEFCRFAERFSASGECNSPLHNAGNFTVTGRGVLHTPYQPIVLRSRILKLNPTKFISLFILTMLWGCGGADAPVDQDYRSMQWSQIVEEGSRSEVQMMMWQGDPLINAFMQDYVVPAVKERYGIELSIANGQGNTIVSILAAELEAGKGRSEIDMMWINGETFYQLKQIKALYGPFADLLPSSQYVNQDDRFINTDFQQPVNGMEAPWGSVQQAWIYNSQMVDSPPRTMAELAAWVQANPGQFTIPNEFTGMSILKALLMELAGGAEALGGAFDEDVYNTYAPQLWEYLNSIKPHFWKQGETFPAQLSAMHQMFASGELAFTMSMNDSEVDNKVLQGLFPETSRAYVPDFGSIRNSHYLGISRLAGSKAGAMLVIDFLSSPEAQLHKQDPSVWGDGTVLDVEKLPQDIRTKFDSLPTRKLAPTREDMIPRALPEPDPEYMIRISKDFRRFVIEA